MNRIYLLLLFISIVFFSIGCKGKEIEEKSKDEIRADINSKPYIVSVITSSPQPLPGKDFRIDVTALDPDKDKVTLSFKWYVNGEFLDGVEENTLPHENFKKGDVIRVEIIPDDGKEKGIPHIIENLTVQNFPPRVKGIRTLPGVATLNDTIKVLAEAEDPDGDEISFKYRWFVNGEEIMENRDNSELVVNRCCKRGDTIWAAVVPNDGEDDGEAVISDTVTIQNSPPIITSIPPRSIKGNTFIYNVTAEDADGDVLEFRLEESPEDMVIDKETGAVRWEVGEREIKNADITIAVFDGNTTTTQSFQLSIPKQ